MEDSKQTPRAFNEEEILAFMFLFRVITQGEEGLNKVTELLGAEAMSIRKLRIRVHDFLEEHTNRNLNFETWEFNNGE